MTDIKKSTVNSDCGSINSRRLKTLLRNLIDIYSPHGKEKEIVDFLYDYLKKFDLPVIRQEVEEDRENLLVIPENGDTNLVLLGHIDTVPAPDFENYKYKEKGKDTIYGLGSADMKGGLAAQIEAYITQWQCNSKHFPAALAIVVGEEENGDGTEKFLEEHHFPYAIVGEPSNLAPCFSQYGYIEANIITQGKRMHASLADSAANPIEAMLHLLLKIMEYLKSNRKEVIYNVRNLSSSHTGFAVPDYCEVWLDFHVPPHAAAIESIIYELEDIFAQSKKESPLLNASINFTYIHSGYQLPIKGHIYEHLKSIYESLALPFDPQSFRSHSDANLLWEAGVRPILLGPGLLEMAHIPGEMVSFNQVVSAAQIYSQLIHALR